jgi:carbon monoxide dehydrogenase subunit G
MGIPIEKSFVVKAPAAAVWEFLTDPVKVASCLPGAAITGKVEGEGQAWGGTMTVKVGPVTASYRGKLRFERLDAAAGEAEIAASGQETRGKGGADMRMKSRVVERAPGETEVTVSSDVNVVGVLAQFGRGMIQDVSDQIFLKFTDAMRRHLEGPGEAGAAGPGGEAAGAPAAPAGSAAPAAGAAPAGGAAPTISAGGTAPTGGTPTVPAGGAGAAGAAPAIPAGGAGGGAVDAATGAAPATAPANRSAAARDDVLDVGSLGAAAFGRAAARTLRRPGFWIAVAVLGLVVYWLASC